MEESEKAVKELVIEDFFIWGESNVALQSFHGGSHVNRMWFLVTIGIQKRTVLSIYFRTIKKSVKVTDQSWELNLNKLLPYYFTLDLKGCFNTSRNVFSLVLVTHSVFLQHLL